MFMSKKIFESLTDKQQKIEKLIQKAKDDEEKAKVELEKVNEELSYLLVDNALGKITKPEITRMKRRRDKLQEIISDTPLLIKGLNRLRIIDI